MDEDTFRMIGCMGMSFSGGKHRIDLTPEYKQNLRNLSKKYRNIGSDTQAVIEQLQTLNFVGDRICGIGDD